MTQLPPEKVIETVANVCRETYIRERLHYERTVRNNPIKYYNPGPKWDGAEDGANTKYGYPCKSIWPGMARFMLEHDLDPEICIMWRFRSRVNMASAPMPNQVHVAHYLPEYRRAMEEFVRQLECQLRTESALFDSQLCSLATVVPTATENVARSLLYSEDVPLSPLFKYCLAHRSKLVDVAEHFHVAALLQFVPLSRAYIEAWGLFIPENFRKEAVRLAASVAGP